MSARTGGSITWQIIFDMAKVENHVDRVLDGPTSEVWIEPWVDYLKAAPRNVTFHPNRAVTDIHCEDGRHHRGRRRGGRTTPAARPRTTRPRSETSHTADRLPVFVAAMPVERLEPLVTPAMRAAEPRLTGLKRLITRWMNGVIFYLDQRCVAAARPRPLHRLRVGADGDLPERSSGPTSTSRSTRRRQGRRDPLGRRRRTGTRPGHRTGKCAMECTQEEIFTEVWGQILDHIDDGSLDTVNVLSQVPRSRDRVPEPERRDQRRAAAGQYRGLVDGPTRKP